jgi:hypothetical protein
MSDEDFKKFAGLLDLKLESSEKRLNDSIQAEGKSVRQGIGDFMDQSLLSQLADKADRSDIEGLRTDIELLPTVAHELKLKKR